MLSRRRIAGLVVALVLVAAAVIVVARSGRAPAHATAGARHSSNSHGATTSTDRAAPTTIATVPATTPTTVATASTASTAATTVTTSGPPWSVRSATLNFYDPTRMSPARGNVAAHAGRALRTTLQWPVSSTGAVAPGRRPLIVFAHGYNVSAATYAAMLDALTRSGAIVAAPEFPGESATYPGHAVEWDLTNEPCDMEFVAAALEHDPPPALRGALTDAPLIVAGHSDGATAAAAAGYASTCSSVPIRAVVAMSSDDVPMTGASRFGTAPALLAMTGTADEINPAAHTFALYRHAPRPAWLVTVDRGSHLGTFTTDPDLARVVAIIADFVFMIADHDAAATARFAHAAGGRIQVQSR